MDLPFTPDGHTERLERYRRYELLRLGQHEEAFKQYIERIGSTYQRDWKAGWGSHFYAINFPKEVSRITADLLFDEKPYITTENNQDFIDTCITELQLFRKFYESADFGSAKGDSIFKITVRDNELQVHPVNPSLYFPIYNESQTYTRPEAEEIHEPVRIEYAGNTIDAILIEKYSTGKIETRLVRKKNNGEIEELPLQQYFPEIPEVVMTGLGENDRLIIHVKNSGVPTEYFGMSDYSDLEDLFYAIDNRFSRNEAILDKHSAPLLVAPPNTLLDKNGQMKRNVDIIELMNMDGSPEIKYVAWDAQMQYAYESLSQSIDLMLSIANIAPSLVGRKTEGGSAESGRALKFRLIRTLAMKHRKEIYWGLAIKDILWTLQKWSQVSGYTVDGMRTQEPELVQVAFQDGVINDPIEQIEYIERQLASGLISQQDAIRAIHDVDEQVAEERLRVIREEKQSHSIFFNPAEPTVEDEIE